MYDKIEEILTELEKAGSLLGFMGDYFKGRNAHGLAICRRIRCLLSNVKGQAENLYPQRQYI